MRRSLASRAIAFTSASVGLRSISRSVSRTQGLASRNVGVGISCSMSGSYAKTERNFYFGACSGRKTGGHFRGTRAIKKRGRFPASPWSPLALRRFNRTRRTHVVHRLLGRNLRPRNHRHQSPAIGFCTKLDMTLDLGEQCMVGAHADIKAGMPGGAALTRDDVAGNHVLAAIGLDSKPLARRITTVTR